MNLQHRSVDCNGYSYLQILLVIALLAILAAVASPYYLEWQQRQRIQSTTLTLLADLRLAQTRAQQRLYNAPWGVHMADASKTYVIFHGTSYQPTDTYNFSVTYPDSIVLNPNQDIVFTPVTGTISRAAAITISSASLPNETATLTISTQGVIAQP